MAAHAEMLKSVFDQATAMSPARTFVLKLQSLPKPTQREIAQALAQDTDILAQSLGGALMSETQLTFCYVLLLAVSTVIGIFCS